MNTPLASPDVKSGTSLPLKVMSNRPGGSKDVATVLLVGNPNAGKTTLFNAMTGLRAKTANFPGTTVDYRVAEVHMGGRDVKLIDLPGLYSLDALSPEERVAERALRGEAPGLQKPDGVILVLDSTHLERNLYLAGEILEMNVPTVVALSLADIAKDAGIVTDAEKLAESLNCPVVPVSGRTTEGVNGLKLELLEILSRGERTAAGDLPETEAPTCSACSRSCPYASRYDWAESVASKVEASPTQSHGRRTEAIDSVLTHPVIGVLAFFAVMIAVFYMIFVLADVPMGLIEGLFASISGWVGGYLPEGLFQSLVVDGVIGGVGGVLVFLPQICILFFFITLLEDSGYMARAAFVMEKLMRRVGLPGKAFVPMLSAHACAIPGIMATRVIEDHRDRLATILVIPLITCSARLPVYSMIAVLLFREEPLAAALMFFGAYTLGGGMAMLMALVFRKSLLKGEVRPMVIELPSYRLPSIRNAVMTTWDRAMVFVRKAGTAILLISIILWACMTFPRMEESDITPAAMAQVEDLRADATATEARLDSLEAGPESDQAELLRTRAKSLRHEADNIVQQQALEYSIAGRVGKAVQPVLAPLGFNWKINVGVVSSFAARETIVSTLAIVYGIGEDATENEATLTETLRSQRHEDGTPVFSIPTCISLLVFFVLAMQCLPTQAVTARETGGWKWAIFQLVYMTVLAYTAALIAYQVSSSFFPA